MVFDFWILVVACSHETFLLMPFTEVDIKNIKRETEVRKVKGYSSKRAISALLIQEIML